ncbi:hypothetical protein A5706_25575 [Mycobacterium sp. E796]|nr:hypothetical protein A5706_25575 [Mycobacterium sp. E796]
MASYLAEHQTRIKVGCMIFGFGMGALFPWVSAISLQLKRIEKGWGMLSITQAVAGLVTPAGALLAVMLYMGGAVYRDPHSISNPDVVQLASDIFWIIFIGTAWPVVFTTLAIALGILTDFSEQPVLPRWLGYLNLWTALCSAPAAALMLFKTGPLAWDGLITFWIPAITFFVWVTSMSIAMLQSLRRESLADPSQATEPAS